MNYIGPKKIKETKDGEKTTNGIEIVDVLYEDGSREFLSKLMFDKIVSEESCDLTKLRDKRLEPLVKETLTVLRNWGIKLSELTQFYALLNLSMQNNEKEALLELWRELIPTLQDPDDIDLINVDLVLKRRKEIPSPYNE
jgi:hypothetical protein